MKLKYQAKKPNRYKNNMLLGYTTFTRGWWYDCENKKWDYNPENLAGHSTHAPCYSVRAFRRKLKDAPKGVEFVLACRFYDCDIIGTGRTPTNVQKEGRE